MNNAELIAVLRYCGNGAKGTGCFNCPIYHEPTESCFQIMIDATDALEAAEKRIAELEAQIPKRGEWIEHEYADIVNGLLVSNYECTVCHEWADKKTDYCPNCGADMRGDAE